MNYLSEIIKLDKDFPFAFYNGVGFSEDDFRDGKAYMHNHFCLELNYALSDGVYYIGDNQYPIQRGDIFIINNYEYHAARNNSTGVMMKIIVFDPTLVWQNDSMDYQYIKAFYEWKSDFKHRLSGNRNLSGEAAGIFAEIEREWEEKKAGYMLVIKAQLLKLLALIYRGFEESESHTEAVGKFQNDYMRIVDAVNYIDSHFQEKISLDELAEVVHMNPNYFSTFFCRVMNYPVSVYIIKQRLRYACMRLATSNDSIITIAANAGFHNVPYFNRVFKEHFGRTPMQYRKYVAEEKEKF